MMGTVGSLIRVGLVGLKLVPVLMTTRWPDVVWMMGFLGLTTTLVVKGSSLVCRGMMGPLGSKVPSMTGTSPSPSNLSFGGFEAMSGRKGLTNGLRMGRPSSGDEGSTSGRSKSLESTEVCWVGDGLKGPAVSGRPLMTLLFKDVSSSATIGF